MRPLPVKLLVAAGGVVLAAGIVLVVALHRSSTGAPAPTQLPAAPSFPGPPSGAIVYSRQLGADALALGVVPKRGRLLVQASVLGRQGEGISGLAVSFEAEGPAKAAAPCGKGCYRALVAAPRRPRSVTVVVRGGTGAPVRWQVALPSAWPPPDAAPLLQRAERAWRKLRSLSFRESLASDPRHATESTWRVESPDRVAYDVKGGWSGIVIGTRRWDRPPKGKRWTASPQTPVTQPVPPWVKVTDAHILGTATVGGRLAWQASFFDPRSHAWFSVSIDRATLRTLDLRMVTTAHFMHDVYGGFDSTPAIAPPH